MILQQQDMNTEMRVNHVVLLREERGHMEVMMDIQRDLQLADHVGL